MNYYELFENRMPLEMRSHHIGIKPKMVEINKRVIGISTHDGQGIIMSTLLYTEPDQDYKDWELHWQDMSRTLQIEG